MCFSSDGEVHLMSYNEFYREAFAEDAKYSLHDDKLYIGPVSIELWPTFQSPHIACDARVKPKTELRLYGCGTDGIDADGAGTAGAFAGRPWIYDDDNDGELAPTALGAEGDRSDKALKAGLTGCWEVLRTARLATPEDPTHQWWAEACFDGKAFGTVTILDCDGHLGAGIHCNSDGWNHAVSSGRLFERHGAWSTSCDISIDRTELRLTRCEKWQRISESQIRPIEARTLRRKAP